MNMDKITKCRNCGGLILSVDGKVWTHVVEGVVKNTWMAVNSKCDKGEI